MTTNTVCPISNERVNENGVRIVATLIFIISAGIIYTHSIYLSVFLIIDFAVRAFSSGDISLLKLLSKIIIHQFKISKKPIDAAPKKFAALIGFLFSLIIAGSILIANNYLFISTTVILLICSGLEAFAGYCLGCQFYTWTIVPYKKIKAKWS